MSELEAKPKATEPEPAKDKKKADKGKDEDAPEPLNEEDQRIKDDLELLVVRAGDVDPGIAAAAIAQLKKEIRTSTGSMTSVPKPLKFLRDHYATLQATHQRLVAAKPEVGRELSDVLSWLGMTLGAATRDTLRYKLTGTKEAVGDWGHEYVAHLCLELGDEYAELQEKAEEANAGQTVNVLDAQLEALADELVTFLVGHNGEPSACDLLMEIERLDKIVEHTTPINHRRIAQYLVSCAGYLPDPEDATALRTAMNIFKRQNRMPDALRLALALDDGDEVASIWGGTTDAAVKKQLALLLGQHGANVHSSKLMADEQDDTLIELLGNVKRTQWFQAVLGKDLDVLEPKLPEDIYKEDIAGKKVVGKKKGTEAKSETKGPAKTDSARDNLASTFVNAFVNAGFSKDKLMTEGAEGEWLFKNREHGRISAAASVGLVCLWDPDSGMNEGDKYSYTKDDYVKAGVMLAAGLTNVNVRTSFDVAFQFLGDHLNDQSSLVRQCAALGLGLAYAGTPHDGVRESLIAAFDDAASTSGSTALELQAHIALSLALNHVGTCDSDLSEMFVSAMFDRANEGTNGEGLKNAYSRYLALAIGLLYLGKQEKCEVVLETLKIVPKPWGQYALTTVETCAYAGSGNVLKIQQLIAICGEKLVDDKEKEKDGKDAKGKDGKEKDAKEKEKEAKEKEKEKEGKASVEGSYQAVAVLGLALVAMREEVGRQMLPRTFDHLMQYGDPAVRRSVPLAMGLLNLCDPDLTVMDTLSKFSHDHDAEVAMAAILGLGLIGAGTNNARIAGLLRSLAQYYAKELGQLFVVRLAQGFLHLGKGTITLQPYHSDRLLLRPAALAGILAALHTMLDVRGLVLGRAHYLLYAVALAMQPRCIITLNPELEPQQVNIRVGTAIDVVGKAGSPKAITGFQTHTSPVLIGTAERAELATEEHLTLAPILEGPVILLPNPEYKPKVKK